MAATWRCEDFSICCGLPRWTAGRAPLPLEIAPVLRCIHKDGYVYITSQPVHEVLERNSQCVAGYLRSPDRRHHHGPERVHFAIVRPT